LAEYWAASLAYCEFSPGMGNDGLTVDLSGGAPDAILRFSAGDGNDTLTIAGTTGLTPLDVRVGQVISGDCTINCTGVESTLLDALAGAVVQLGSLTLSAPLALTAGKGLLLRANALVISGAGSLDLADGKLILDYTGGTPAQTVLAWVANGQAGSTPSIQSTALDPTQRLAMIDNTLVHMPSFAGQALASPFSQILIQPALRGDANLDGKVDEHDLLSIFANMSRSSAQWLLGDLDQDGNVDLDDYAQVAANMGAGLAMAGKSRPTLGRAVEAGATFCKEDG
jgi:hypothetical protein